MQEEDRLNRLRSQLEQSIASGLDEHLEARLDRPVLDLLRDLDDVQLISKANTELKRRNTFLYYSLIGLGLVTIALAFSTTVMFMRGAPDCNSVRFNTNNRGVQCYGVNCYK